MTAFDAALQQLAKDMFHTMYRRAAPASEGGGAAGRAQGVLPRPPPAAVTSLSQTVPLFPSHRRTEGIGLAAPQVGVNVRMMVFNEAGVEGQGREVVRSLTPIPQRAHSNPEKPLPTHRQLTGAPWRRRFRCC